MSGAATPGQDPSMEDILASIRKILNEEEEAAQRPAPPLPSAAREPLELAPEPLELTEEMLVSPVIGPAPGPVPAPVPTPLPAAAAPAAPVAPSPTPVTPVPAPAPAPAPGLSNAAEGLVAPATAAAAAALIGQLARTVAAERTAPVHRGGPSIEDVVREELRPLLKEWMDAHLPAMMERLVRAEIERVVSRSLG
jgi:cell pole-organizing protein PopZ